MRNIVFILILTVCLSSCKIRNTHRPLVRNWTFEADRIENVKELESEQKDDASIELIESVNNSIVLSPADIKEQILRRKAYTSSYNCDTRNPNWVAWELTGRHTNGKNKRQGLSFQEDYDVPTPRATNMDYMQSGYDRGHMCPSADNKWSEQAQKESFLYTNCCPQDHTLNAGSWNDLESVCRRWARRYGKIWIACGPVYNGEKHRRIGRNKVFVPEGFFKVVLANDGGRYMALGFLFENTPTADRFTQYVKTVDEVEKITGYDFFAFLPDSIENSIEANSDIDNWQKRQRK